MLGRTNSAGGVAIVGEKSIYANGTYNASSDDLDGYSSVIVNVPSTLKTLLDATKSAYYLFQNYAGASVEGLIQYSDTEEVTEFRYMFDGCINLTAVPLLDTGEATYMTRMFNNCSSLLTVPQFDTINVVNMTYMFASCSALTSILMYNIKANLDVSSTALQHDAIVVLIGNLYDFVGAGESTTRTLTIGATKLGYLSQAEKDVATAKGWTLA